MKDLHEHVDEGIEITTTQLTAAIKAVDKAFDLNGYALKHPEVVAAFMQCAAANVGVSISSDMQNMVMGDMI